MSLAALVDFVREWRAAHPRGGKDALVAALTERFELKRAGALLASPSFVVRVSENSSDHGFPNAVVAFRKIIENDDRPVVVCLLTPNRCLLHLANTTFLRKVTHSSHGLTEHKLVGSILGGDIVGEYEGITNAAENLTRLWELHQSADHAAHLARIIAATIAIRASGVGWAPTPAELDRILASPVLASRVSTAAEYAAVARALDATVQGQHLRILEAAKDSSPKRRGDRIEEIVTGAAKNQGLGDLVVEVLTTTIAIDVKSKRLDKSSAPKGYNIDKALRELARGNRLVAMLFVGVDPEAGLLTTRLASIFDRRLIASARIDARWSGRGTRGTVQFSGSVIDTLWAPNFTEDVDVEVAMSFLRRLIASSAAGQETASH